MPLYREASHPLPGVGAPIESVSPPPTTQMLEITFDCPPRHLGLLPAQQNRHRLLSCASAEADTVNPEEAGVRLIISPGGELTQAAVNQSRLNHQLFVINPAHDEGIAASRMSNETKRRLQPSENALVLQPHPTSPKNTPLRGLTAYEAVMDVAHENGLGDAEASQRITERVHEIQKDAGMVIAAVVEIAETSPSRVSLRNAKILGVTAYAASVAIGAKNGYDTLLLTDALLALGFTGTKIINMTTDHLARDTPKSQHQGETPSGSTAQIPHQREPQTPRPGLLTDHPHPRGSSTPKA